MVHTLFEVQDFVDLDLESRLAAICVFQDCDDNFEIITSVGEHKDCVNTYLQEKGLVGYQGSSGIMCYIFELYPNEANDKIVIVASNEETLVSCYSFIHNKAQEYGYLLGYYENRHSSVVCTVS